MGWGALTSTTGRMRALEDEMRGEYAALVAMAYRRMRQGADAALPSDLLSQLIHHARSCKAKPIL
jgi:hypothetical protein